ncbi:MAG: TlpA family protein disulfide reductase [Burkholderiales bacterium]|nr:TlpA family protein disulfide reductase [Burkholderiales bacterium]
MNIPNHPRRAWLARALGCAAAAAWPARPAQANELQLGAPAPPLVLHTIDGRRIATRDLLGQVVLVNFWATWCPPCIDEMPQLSAYAASRAAQGLQVLGFCLDDAANLGQVRALAASLPYPVGLLGSAWAGGYGRIWRCPVNFVIDRAGRLAHDGWNDATATPWSGAQFARVVDPVLRRHEPRRDAPL